MSKRPMGGVTLSPEYATSLRDWKRERKSREEAIKGARKEGMTEEEILSMPSPRGWWEYAIDPRSDGAPTSRNSDAPGQLDRSSNKNTDALVLQPWWDEASVGHDTQKIVQYQQMMKSDISNIPSALQYYLDDALTPDIFVRTSMADYIPSMFNIFTDSNGDRLDPSKQEKLWKRTGQTLFQGGTGLVVMGGVTLGALKLMPKATDAVMETAESVIEGGIEIVMGVLTTIRTGLMRSQEAKEAITGD